MVSSGTWVVVLFTLFFFIIIIRSSYDPSPTQDRLSFEIQSNSNQSSRSCWYTVIIKTSCSSISYTTDQLSLAFGDDYGNEVYAPMINDPDTRTFEACSKYTLFLREPCMDLICYIYLLRNGSDGWKPKSMIISGSYVRPIIFNIDEFLIDGEWFGLDMCIGVSNSASFHYAFL